MLLCLAVTTESPEASPPVRRLSGVGSAEVWAQDSQTGIQRLSLHTERGLGAQAVGPSSLREGRPVLERSALCLTCGRPCGRHRRRGICAEPLARRPVSRALEGLLPVAPMAWPLLELSCWERRLWWEPSSPVQA